MRVKVSTFLRKLADFLDPRVKPSPEPMTIELVLDATQAVAELERLRAEFRECFDRDLPVIE